MVMEELWKWTAELKRLIIKDLSDIQKEGRDVFIRCVKVYPFSEGCRHVIK